MESETFTDAFNKLRTKLHRVACGILRDEADAEDAVQDAFFNFWKADRCNTSDEARHKLFVILRNVCIDKLRLKRPRGELSENSSVGYQDPIEEFDKTMSLLLTALPPLQRQVFEMAVINEMEYEAISLRLGISLEAVRANMCRARMKVREQYKIINR